MVSFIQSFVRYTSDVEKPEHDEAETTKGLIETLRSISEQTLADGRHALRSVHAKAHGVLRGELEVSGSLPEYLAQGLFAKPGRYPVVMRFREQLQRGEKLLGVGSAEGRPVHQDEILGDVGLRPFEAIALDADDLDRQSAGRGHAVVEDVARNSGKTTDRAEGFKKVVSGALRGVQSAIVAATGTPNATVATLGGQLETHILGETFYSQVPVRFGDYIAKLAVAPVSPELTALTQSPLNVNGVPNGLREAVVKFFGSRGGTWEVRAQLCTDLDEMPVEDASKVWPEKQSPYRAVARITVKPQTAWSGNRSAAVDDGMSFTPWHGLASHRPMGSIMRVRKMAYEMGRRFRSEKGGRTIQEPKEVVHLRIDRHLSF